MTKKIAFANTLKPVDDVRTFEKLAQTIAKTNKYEVNIIGNSGKKESKHESIHFYSNHITSKSIVTRLSIRVKVLRILLKIQPDLLVIGTHELLGMVLILKIVSRVKVVYDVRENYKKNIIHLSKLPLLFRHMAGHLVRIKEVLTSSFIDTYWLAEKCYEQELLFARNKNIVLENKAKKPEKFIAKKSSFTLLFSGSLSNYSQVLLAVTCHQKLKEENSETFLKIVGQYHGEEIKRELEKASKLDSHLLLSISDVPVSHQKILNEISNADAGVISYQTDVVNKDKIPTKLYEYSRHSLPFLIQQDTNWAIIGKELGGAIPIDFAAPDIPFIFEKLKDRASLFPESYPKEATWEAQEPILLDSIENLLN